MSESNENDKTRIVDSKSVRHRDDVSFSVDLTKSTPQEIGRYRIIRVLGRGGFGTVLLAEDQQLNRPVAIKLPHSHLLASDTAAYLEEAQIVASLDHEHIVPVYDVGSTDSYPFYIVSKFVDGTTLGVQIRTQRLQPVEGCQLVATIADALHYAHKRGLVHRDVKPGNILLGLDNKPYLVDFGLALRDDRFGTGPVCAGTPSYMSPEQARGEGHRVDGRSDVFSLGVVFYELLTGQKPFRGSNHSEVLQQVQSYEPKPPRQFDDRIPRELERICFRAMEKQASDRYPTALDLSDDLRHFLNQHQVSQSLNRTGTFPTTPQGFLAAIDVSAVETLTIEAKNNDTGDLIPSSPQASERQLHIVPKGLRSLILATLTSF